MDVILSVPSLTCGHCAAQIEPILGEFAVRQYDVDLEKQQVRIKGISDLQRLLAKLKSVGFDATAIQSNQPKVWLTLKVKLIVAWLCTLPLLGHMFIAWHVLHNPWLHLILAAPVMLIGLLHFGPGFIADVKKRSFSMDSLILIGSSAAFLYSLASLRGQNSQEYLFFESAASIIAIVLLGTFIENRALKKTVAALKRNTVEEQALVRKRQKADRNDVLEVAAGTLAKGDIILLGLGESLPTDGTVIHGSGTVDCAVITGESEPLVVQIGSTLPAGSKIIQGSFDIQVLEPLTSSTLSQIEQAVQQARRDRPSIQALGDKAASIFVPTVIAIAIITIFANKAAGHTWGEALLRAVAVLVISCPCAIGLAIPAASATALGTAADRGIVIKTTRVFGLLAAVKNIVFDKTGTITERTLEIASAKFDSAVAPASHRQLQQIAYSLASHSRHPVAQAIREYLKDSVDGGAEFPMTDTQELSGIGIQAKYNGELFRISRDRDNTVFYVSEKPTIFFDVLSRNKPFTSELFRWLEKSNIKTILASGDTASRVTSLAKNLGISEHYAEMRPEQKTDLVAMVQISGPTMMVGDGVNDAAALAQATVGVSFIDGMSISQASSDVVIMSSSLRSIQDLLVLAKKTDTIMRQNLVWAFLYNVIAIPIAACGYLSPTLAAFAMAASDVVVLGNSLRLRRMPRI